MRTLRLHRQSPVAAAQVYVHVLADRADHNTVHVHVHVLEQLTTRTNVPELACCAAGMGGRPAIISILQCRPSSRSRSRGLGGFAVLAIDI